MTLPRTAADVLSGHVVFEVESIDRMYLNVWQPRLQHGAGAAAFFTSHRGHAYASTALMDPVTGREDLTVMSYRAHVAGGLSDPVSIDIPTGTFAWMQDPEGNTVGLWKAKS